MTIEINTILANSETFKEFYSQADQYIAEEIAQEESMREKIEITADEILTEQIEARAKEYWDAWVNSNLPF